MGIADIIAQKEDAVFGTGASVADVDRAEQQLGLQFASDYREYLKQYSLIMYDGHELTGISKSKHVNVVDVTLAHVPERKSPDMYVLEDLGIDGIIIWQNSKGEVYMGNRKICNGLVEYIEGKNETNLAE